MCIDLQKAHHQLLYNLCATRSPYLYRGIIYALGVDRLEVMGVLFFKYKRLCLEAKALLLFIARRG
jgi:hypothetical protein